MKIWVKPICWKMFALISSNANLNCLDVPCSPPLGSNKGGTFIGISSKDDRCIIISKEYGFPSSRLNLEWEIREQWEDMKWIGWMRGTSWGGFVGEERRVYEYIRGTRTVNQPPPKCEEETKRGDRDDLDWAKRWNREEKVWNNFLGNLFWLLHKGFERQKVNKKASKKHSKK